MKMTAEEALRHAGPLVTERIWARVQQGLPHYIWMWGRGKEKSGICSHCHYVMIGREEMEWDSWPNNDPYLDQEEMRPFAWPGWYKKEATGESDCRHGQQGYCPNCGSLITYRDMARGHESLCDRLYYVDYRKSVEGPEIMVMVGYEEAASWKKPLHEWMPAGEIAPDIRIEPCVICIFQRGRRGQRFMRKWLWEPIWEREADGRLPVRGYLGPFRRAAQCNDCYMPFGKTSGIPYLRHRQDFKDALSGTWWGMIGEAVGLHENQGAITRIPEMDAISSTPCVEYLAKLGMEELARVAIDRRPYRDCPLNLRGKDACSVLGISPDAWGWLKGHGKKPDVGYLKIARLIDEKGIRLSLADIWQLSRVQGFHGLSMLLERCRDAGHMRKCLRYILKKGIGANDYADHLRILTELGLSPQDQEMAYPNDFRRIHALLSQRIKVRADRVAAEKLAAFLQSLRGYCFSAFGLVLSPIPTIPDVVKEGQALHHCVGTYASRYANGQTILCTLREESALDTPLYTVEFSTLTGSMVQCRGDHNRTRPQDEERLEGFWRVFNLMRRDATAISTARKGRAA